MKILLCNDDGYKARGLHVLAQIMSGFGDVQVVAPKFHQSAMSCAVSLGVKQLAYKDLPEEGPGKWTYLDATPASCVKFGLEFKYDHRDPDLVVTGINHGTNASTAANYSATLGAAEEAAINGIKAIGVSLCDFRPDADFSAVQAMLPEIMRKVLDDWPENRPGLVYNINFPAVPLEDIKGVKYARQGFGHWEKEFEAFIKPQRTAKGNRQFTMKDIEVLKQIKYLVKDCGMTLDGASKRLSKNRTDVEANMEIVSRLEEIKEMLVGIKNEM